MKKNSKQLKVIKSFKEDEVDGKYNSEELNYIKNEGTTTDLIILDNLTESEDKNIIYEMEKKSNYDKVTYLSKCSGDVGKESNMMICNAKHKDAVMEGFRNTYPQLSDEQLEIVFEYRSGNINDKKLQQAYYESKNNYFNPTILQEKSLYDLSTEEEEYITKYDDLIESEYKDR